MALRLLKRSRGIFQSARNAAVATSSASTIDANSARLTLRRCRRTMIVNHLTSESHQEASQLIRDAASRADNIGVDEYPTIQHFQRLVDRSNAAVGLWEADGSRLLAVILVSPCIYARSERPTLCTVVVVTSGQLGDAGWRDVIDVAMDTASRLPELYSASIMNVFVTCVSRILALRDAGFMITACIPYAGKVAGIPGYVGNYLMYKELGNVPQPPTLIKDESGRDIYRPQLVEIPSLPVRRTLRDGTSVIVRNMRHDDVKPFYDVLQSAAESGHGYGHDELPTFDLFAREYIDGSQAVVAELAQTGETVYYANFGPSLYARTSDPVIRDGGNMAVLPQYRRRKWFEDIGLLVYHILDESASRMRGYQGDAAVTSLSSYVGALRANCVVNGVLPRGIYFREHGWIDVMLYYRTSDDSRETIGNFDAKL